MRCCRTNSKDSLYSFARRFLNTPSVQVKIAVPFDSPDGDLAHDVVLHLEFLHLPITDGTVLALEELLLDLVPWANILPLQSDLHPIRVQKSVDC